MPERSAEALIAGIARRLQLPGLLARHDARWVRAAFALVNGLLSIGTLALVAWASGAPFLFPSLGPTAFLFFYAPSSAAASPRSTLVGHLVAVLAGVGSLAAFGLLDAGPALDGVSLARAGAAALSLGATSGAMVLLRAPHPPAGATTLIVSMGLMTRPLELAALMAAVALLTCQAWGINRIAGLAPPVWAAREG